MKTKEALALAMHWAAAHCNRVRALAALAGQINPETFTRLAGQHPGTLQRDLQWAVDGYQQAKNAYEAYCREIGEPAYATYDYD